MEEDWSRIAGTSRPDAPSSSSNHALVFRENFCPEFWFQSSVCFGSHPHSAAPCRVPHWWCLCLPGGRFYFFSFFFFFLAALTILLKPPQSVFPFTDGAESSASLWHPRVFLHLCLWGCSPPYRTQGEERRRHRKTTAASPQEYCNKTFRKELKKKVSLEGLFLSFIRKHRNVQNASMQNVGWEQVCRKTLQTSNDKRTIGLTWLCPGPRAALQQLSFNSTSSLARWQQLLRSFLHFCFISDSSGSQAAPSRHANLYSFDVQFFLLKLCWKS